MYHITGGYRKGGVTAVSTETVPFFLGALNVHPSQVTVPYLCQDLLIRR